jgi:TatD DNase family protein
MFIDSHVHLDDKKYSHDREEVIQRAWEQDLDLIINVGESVGSSLKTIELAEKHPYIYASVGIHPHHAQEIREHDIAKIKELSQKEKVIAIGEIGLDYYYDFSPREAQLDLFLKQLALAKDLSLPIIVHNRESDNDCLAGFQRLFSSKVKGCMHCFSGDKEFALNCLDLGLYISFAGQITFPKADNLREVVKIVPLEKMLIETDSPYLAPQIKRGKRNEPAYVQYVAEKIAEIKNVTLEEVAETTSQNTKTLFSLP